MRPMDSMRWSWVGLASAVDLEQARNAGAICGPPHDVIHIISVLLLLDLWLTSLRSTD